MKTFVDDACHAQRLTRGKWSKRVALTCSIMSIMNMPWLSHHLAHGTDPLLILQLVSVGFVNRENPADYGILNKKSQNGVRIVQRTLGKASTESSERLFKCPTYIHLYSAFATSTQSMQLSNTELSTRYSILVWDVWVTISPHHYMKMEILLYFGFVLQVCFFIFQYQSRKALALCTLRSSS